MKAWLRRHWLAVRQLVRGELRANASPLKASLSFTVGVCIAFSPFFGLHYIMAVPLAFIFRLNRPLTLLGVSITVFPTIPFVIAAGFFIGKTVISQEQADRILVACRHGLPDHLFDRAVDWIAAASNRFIPDYISGLIVRDSGAGLMTGIVQWLIGGSLLAVACAIGTFAITFPAFYYVNKMFHRLETTKTEAE